MLMGISRINLPVDIKILENRLVRLVKLASSLNVNSLLDSRIQTKTLCILQGVFFYENWRCAIRIVQRLFSRIEICTKPLKKQCFLVHQKLQNQGNPTDFSQKSQMASKGLETSVRLTHQLKQQCCLIHISRNLASKVKRADRAVILSTYNDLSC